jgi:hypothetical protein
MRKKIVEQIIKITVIWVLPPNRRRLIMDRLKNSGIQIANTMPSQPKNFDLLDQIRKEEE